jgi:hypothetical protein
LLVRYADKHAGTLIDVHAPVLAAAGHIVTLENRFGGSWRTFSELTWGDQDTFVLGQPRHGQVLSRLGVGLTDNLTSAVARLIAGMEVLKQPRSVLAVFDVSLGKKTFKVVVSEQRHLDGITAALHRHNQGCPDGSIKTEADYVQFVLSHWCRGDAASAVVQHNAACPDDEMVKTPQEALQATLDRAVESYYSEMVARRP